LKTPKNILIQQLKQQQRLGAKKNKTLADKTLADNMAKAGRAAAGATDVFQEFVDNVTAASTQQAKLGSGLARTRGIFDEFSKAAKEAAKNIGSIFEASKDLNTSFGMSAEAAFDFSKELRKLPLDIGNKKLLQYASSLGKLTGGYITSTKANTDFTKELVKTQTFLQNNLKLSDEQAQKFELNAAALGRTGAQSIGMIGKVAATFKDALGMDQTQVISQITADISEMGADTVAQFGRIPGQLEQATMKARLLGTTMTDLSKTGESLLNIESSVGAEMELQLLTGKRILTEDGKSLTNAFRMAQLQGNGVKQAELMQQYLEEHGDELDNNFLARKKASELFGIDAAKLIEMKGTLQLTKRLGVTKLVQEAEGDLTALSAKLKERGATQDEIKEIIKGTDVRTPAERSADALDRIDSKIIAGAQVGTGAAAVAGVDAELDRTLNTFREAGTILATPEVNEAFGLFGVIADRLSSAKPSLEIFKNAILSLGKLPTFRAPEINAAAGGYITGPGTGTSDSIPARLSSGEYVINAASTRKNRALLDKINNAPVKMAAGGPVGSTAKMESLLATMVTLMRGGNILGETSMNGRKRI
jgi:hypothetical protein